MKACRSCFTETLLELAKQDKDIFAVTTDASGSVTLGDFAKALPEQFVEMGIAEQDSVGVSSGLALSGKKVFCCGPACFLAARSFEQVKIDVAYNHTNVKVIGVSGGLSYGPLGATHTTLHDIASMRALPDIMVVLPADGAQTVALTKQLAAYDGPAYVRMGRGAVPDLYTGEESFTLGKAHQIREGSDLTLIACGEMVYYAAEAGKMLEAQGIHARILDMHTVKPLDQEAVLAAAKDTGLIVTVEEHMVHGGLGSAVAELLSDKNPIPVKIMGLPDENIIAGTSTELFAYYHIDAQGIFDAANEMLKKFK